MTAAAPQVPLARNPPLELHLLPRPGKRISAGRRSTNNSPRLLAARHSVKADSAAGAGAEAAAEAAEDCSAAGIAAGCTFSLTDTMTFVDKVRIGPGQPEIDYLHGDAAGQNGGTPRHSVQAQTGYFNNGLGARLVSNWRSGSTVNTLTGDNLRFSPLTTFDLRLFANPGDIPEVVTKHPWLRGSQVQLQITNLLDSRPKVHDASGRVPLSYQPDLLDPLGTHDHDQFPEAVPAEPELVPPTVSGRPAAGRRAERGFSRLAQYALARGHDEGSAHSGHAKLAW